MSKGSKKEYVKGKASLSWETYSVVELDDSANRCTGCNDLFYLGEVIAQLQLDKTMWRFNISCFQQLIVVLSTFWDTTQDKVTGATVRHN